MSLGDVGVHALVAYDSSKADTRRSIAAAVGTATGSFDVSGQTVDVSVDHKARIAENFALQSRVGVTYMHVERDGLAESSASAFALAVAEETVDAWFIDGGLTLSGHVDLWGRQISPFASVGIRHQLKGDLIHASARLTGTTAGLLTVAGAGRSETVATLGTGFSLDVTSNLRLFGAYNAELSGKSDRHNVTGGLGLQF